MATKVFHPPIKIAKSAPRIDLSSCLALTQRARATDVLILCFGIGLGVLFYALLHDVVLRFRSQPPSHPPSQHGSLSSRDPGPKYLVVPTIYRSHRLDEKV